MPSLKMRLGLALTVSVQMGLSVAQPVGEVDFARGVGFAQSTGKPARTLGQGLPLQEGDRLVTSEGASAVIKMQDGTRMTIRPNSDMVIQQFRFATAEPLNNSMVLRLLKGGLRAITGLVSKGSSNSARIVTPTATIGIRGTDFDARLCAADCRSESAKVPIKPRSNVVNASAKVVSTQGELSALDGSTGARRVLAQGASIYPGETLETRADSKAVIAFRDESRMSLGASTRFRVDSFVFDEQNPQEGRFLVSLFKGSLRALTGLIGKSNNRNVRLTTPTATIGIRGTGLDMDCSTDASAACNFYTWQGTIEVMPNDHTDVRVLEVGQGLYVSKTEVRHTTSPTLNHLERPDSIPVEVKQLFTINNSLEDNQEGLYVYVRDGHIEVTTPAQTLHLGRGEAGLATPNGQTVRPPLMPLFLEFDTTPMPNSSNPLLASILGESGVKPLQQCR
jgi:hypothetical protein